MFGKNAVGIFLGPQGLSIVETAITGKVKNFIYSPYPKDITRPSGAAVPRDNIFNVFLDNEVEIVAFMQRALRESRVNMDNSSFVVCVPNRDLIVRFFEIPPVPRKDIKATISFEIKKYIPFKTEDITYDYQIFSQKNIIEVLFAGMKNEDIKKYNSVLSQIRANISAIEPSQFALFRLLKVKKIISNKEAVVVAELEKGEGVISIIDNGIPCFSRDIKISAGEETQPVDAESVSFRIINEIRVSIDYFRRQFLKKGVDRIIILSKEESKDLINTFNRELGMPVQHKSPDDILGIREEHSLSLAKAAGASLRINKHSSLFINLAKTRKSSASSLLSPGDMLSAVFGDIIDIPKPLIIKTLSFALVALLGIFMWGNYRLKPINEEIYSQSREISSILTADLKDLDNSVLENLRNKDKEKLAAYRSVFIKEFLLGEKLEVLTELLPEGVWLEALSFDRPGKYINLRGVVYNKNDNEAQQAPYVLISNLKSSPTFSNKVGNISVKSLRSSIEKDYKVIRFELEGAIKI
ncbi:MAG: pilus assembly protein PilM [Candidatus Omnitrophica bacterium]|nr:pilus assembly protein PilM [Candidatus Omnitrophota bacterium]